MRDFTIEDFAGSGQYLVRMSPKELELRKDNNFVNVQSTGFLSTIMYKVGYYFGGKNQGHTKYLFSMADGMVMKVFDPNDQWETNPEIPAQMMVDWLNKEKIYRFATQEEVVRVVMHQSARWRN